MNCYDNLLSIWRPEAESLLVLKNNRGVRRQPCSPYGLWCTTKQINVSTLNQGGDITLFSPSDVEGL